MNLSEASDLKILVTGLNGLIGWNLFKALSEKFLTYGTYRQPHTALPKERIFRLDMNSAEELGKLLDKIRPDYLIHAWAMCDLDVCEQFPEMAEKINVEGARAILGAAARVKNLRKIIYISTDHVFSGERGGYLEEDAPDPKHIYGRTKLSAEKLVRSSGIPFVIVRPGLVIGSSLQGNKGPRDFLVYRAGQGKPTHYFTDEWRTPILAPLLAEKVMGLMLSHEEGIFHVAGETLFSRYELALKLALHGGLSGEYVFPRLREEDKWAHIRPKNIGLKSGRLSAEAFDLSKFFPILSG